MNNGINNIRGFMANKFDFAPTGHWKYHLKTDQFWCSTKAKKIIGLSSKSNDILLGEIEKFIPKNEKTTQALIELFDRKEFDFEYIINDPTSRTLRCYAEIKCDNNGNAESIVGVIQDITENVNAFNNIIQLNQQLRQFSADCLDVMEDERVTLSREIRENIGQKILAVKSEIEMVSQLLRDGITDSFEESIHTIDILNEGAIYAAKAIVGGLKVEEIKLLGFIEASKMLVNDLKNRYNLSVELNLPVTLTGLEPNQTIVLYRILKEVLINIIEHSTSTQTTIGLTENADSLILEIKAETDTFEAGLFEWDELVLFTLEQQAKLIQAELSIQKTNDKTSLINLRIPFNE